MMELFAGHEKMHGTHGEPHRDTDSLKWEIKKSARTLREPPTLQMWEKHLSGERALGIVPTTEEGECHWGSIDVDVYDEEHLPLVARVLKEKLPLVPCRSKSGGLHLFLFLKEPQSAVTVQSLLRDVAAQLGLAGSEIFPKQTQIMFDRGDMGNWMVMPYFGSTYGGKLKEQVGLKKTGAEQTITEFLDFAERRSLDDAGFEEVGRPRARRGAKSSDGPFGDGPPCLAHLASKGVHEHEGRNNALFHMAIYHKKATPGSWQDAVEESNRQHMHPPLTADEVTGVLRQLEKKEYEYTCKNEPMCSHCDVMACRGRKFGVGQGGWWPSITSITKLKTDPPVWFVDVEDSRVECSTDQLQNYNLFHKLCLNALGKAFMPMKQADWWFELNKALDQRTEIEAPQEVGRTGTFTEYLEEFLTNRARGQRKEDILAGRPWLSEDDSRHYFRLRDLMKHLEREKLRDWSRTEVMSILGRIGGSHGFWNLSGRGVNWWSVPTSSIADAPVLDPPIPQRETV